MVDGPVSTHYVYVIIMEYCESGDLTDLIRGEGSEGKVISI